MRPSHGPSPPFPFPFSPQCPPDSEIVSTVNTCYVKKHFYGKIHFFYTAEEKPKTIQVFYINKSIIYF